LGPESWRVRGAAESCRILVVVVVVIIIIIVIIIAVRLDV
jgi:hypothetical protein